MQLELPLSYTETLTKPCKYCLEHDNFVLEDAWWDSEYDFKTYRCTTTLYDEHDGDVAICGGITEITTRHSGDRDE